MVNAQQWLNKWYPEDGTCQRKEDQENYGKTRKEIKNLNIMNQNLEGDLDLSVFSNLESLNIGNSQLNIKLHPNFLEVQLQKSDERISYLEWKWDESPNNPIKIKEIKKNIEERIKELEKLNLPKETWTLVEKLVKINEEYTAFNVKNHGNSLSVYREELLNYGKKIRSIEKEIETEVDKNDKVNEDTMEEIEALIHDYKRLTELSLELENIFEEKKKEIEKKEELIRQFKEVKSQIQILPK